MQLLLAATLQLVLFWSSAVAASSDAGGFAVVPPISDRIGEIRFVGNDVTNKRILLQEMTISVGDVIDANRIETSRQAIMDLGLFKWVRARLEPGDAGQVLVISVSEKYYVLPLPKLDRDVDGNFTFGAQVRIDNLAGLNQRLKLMYQDEQLDWTDEHKKSTSLSYTYPRAGGTSYQIESEFLIADQPQEIGSGETLTQYDERALGVELGVSRWLLKEGPSTGWRVGGGIRWRDITSDNVEGAQTSLPDHNPIGVTFSVSNTNVHDFLYSRGGAEYGWNGELGAPLLGSDTSYSRNGFFYRRFFPFSARPHTTFAFQAQLGAAEGTVADEDAAYALGGGSTLRAYDSDSAEGDAYVLFNFEWLTPVMREHPAMRGLLFVDTGNAYHDVGDIDLSRLLTSVGAGLRWKLKSFVKLDLRLDFAYAIDQDEFKILAGTHDTF